MNYIIALKTITDNSQNYDFELKRYTYEKELNSVKMVMNVEYSLVTNWQMRWLGQNHIYPKYFCMV